MDKLKIIIIATIVGIVVIIFLLVTFLSGLKKQPQQNPSTFTSPAPIQFPASKLYIKSITPTDTSRSYLPPQPLQVIFTQDVLPTALRYTTSPQTEVLIRVENTPSSLIIAPKTFWPNGTIIITILETTISKQGETLKNPQAYRLHIEVPTIPILGTEDY